MINNALKPQFKAQNDARTDRDIEEHKMIETCVRLMLKSKLARSDQMRRLRLKQTHQPQQLELE